MKLLICGDRRWTNGALIEKWIATLKPTLIIHGGCRGADILAGEAAKRLGVKVSVFMPDWARFGRGAGPVRNQQMLDEGNPDRILAFHNDLAHSRGTIDMVRRAKRAGLDVRVISEGR
jgi:hypothetical protein